MCYSKVTIYACKCKEREKANCHQPGPACNEKLAHEVVNMSREFCYRHSGHSDRMDLDPLPGKNANASAAYNPSKGFPGGYPTNTGGEGMISPDFGPEYDLNSPVSPISLRDLPTFPVPTSTRQATSRGGPSKATKTATVAPQSNRNNGPLFAERSRTAQSPVNKAGNAKTPATDGIADPLRRRKDGQRVSKMTYRIGNAVNDLASINQPGLDLSGSRSSLGLRGRTIGPVDVPTIPDHVFEFDHPMPKSPTIARRGARKARQAAIEGNGKAKAGGGDKATRATKTETRQPIITTRETPSFPGQRPNFPLTDPMTAFKPEYYVSSFAQPTTNTATTTTKTFNRPSGPPAPINTANVAKPSTSHYNTRSRANTNKTSPTYAGVRKQQRPATGPISPRTLAAATNARLRAQHQHQPQPQPQVRQPNNKNQNIENGKEGKLGQYRLFPSTNRVQAPPVNKSPYRGNPPPPPPPPPRSNTRPMRPPQPPPRAPVYVNNKRVPPTKQHGRGGRGSGKKGTCEIM
ncbi:hypothetical protein PV10_07671 [Exophiala mesophila]|uniref:Uncharacterized protein n=1 Tax=Exophiala mesophila TaxID=212818 RepID=A0A0D1WMV8_EXOME|nr:uncharacterized protein PV10_07671 [Exophiala mesophila]KIV90360.1 hypothetical protein PV10_07671 [Exophiala mesophila]